MIQKYGEVTISEKDITFSNFHLNGMDGKDVIKEVIDWAIECLENENKTRRNEVTESEKEKNTTGFIQIGNQTIPMNGTITWAGTGDWCNCEKKAVVAKNPYVPKEIHVDEYAQIIVVKWEDGTETKVTCDVQDNFSVDVGFGMALTEHIFGGKHQFKEKWWKIIQRRIKYHGNTSKEISKPLTKLLIKSKRK